MRTATNGELIWVHADGRVRVALHVPSLTKLRTAPQTARVAGVWVPVMHRVPPRGVLYRHPVRVVERDGEWTAGPVFAILAAAGGHPFRGDRADFRAITAAGRARRAFVYVLPTDGIREGGWWKGFVRIGPGRWLALPCPAPQAVYNRIPNRKLERLPVSQRAKQMLSEQGIPMFNPGYFDKAVIYEIIQRAGLSRYLPESATDLDAATLHQMLQRHDAVYLKPVGGSIGHGILRIDRQGRGFRVAVLKHRRCEVHLAAGWPQAWRLVCRHRLRSRYVVQAAVPLIRHQGHPCDFRVLLQKRDGAWEVVGKGVRVAGRNAITTHVPNGGHIARAAEVLEEVFGEQGDDVHQSVDEMALQCARAIDAHYAHRLGEMSMDIGVDADGHPWFFEANAKPMKFDEPEIRQRSLAGVLDQLEALARREAR
ncbi:YheC/YheD family protein [Alicyclobacillus sp.]|uniref:YheC/YheD family endospore coat-associated protein n=1 Tax=Alicyclobacillus sp. TaxID=61169 RepID=UPI0025BC008E|nr:YheC/YheD family protein [Alicyclobacillus sp.]MCL6516245.1 YheC/YheD family protein [Alicyclobacillus sp.]